MYTKVKGLYDAVKNKYRLTLHCGAGGISNTASWVYLAEDIQNLSFLKGGEFIITTGLFRQSGAGLYDFVRSSAAHNCSGILLNVGQYVFAEDITPEITAFCESNHFPLFSMPWEIHLVDIMQDFCRILLQDNRRDDELSAAFQRAFDGDPVPERVLRTLNLHGFATKGRYMVSVIRNLTDITRVTSPLNAFGILYHLLPHDNRYVLIYDSAQKQFTFDDAAGLLCFCGGIAFGACEAEESLSQLPTAYKRACFALAVAEFRRLQFLRFDMLGPHQLLFCTSDRELLREYARRRIGALERYDAAHGSDYLGTLKAFLLADGSLLKAAEHIHAHRNTVVYRMRRIRELLGSGLGGFAEKSDLLLALYIREYLSM